MRATLPQVVSLHVCPDKAQPMKSRKRITLVEDKGVLGDRYLRLRGTFSKKNGPDRQVTLIEEEALVAARRDYKLRIKSASVRRNIVTRGVALNHLVGERFTVGDAVLEGVRLCEPCGHLGKLLDNDRVRDALIHRGGLRCRIVKGGVVAIGDDIVA